MRPKSLILLALAGGCGIVASIGVSQVLDSKGKGPVQLQTKPIYVALHNINLGDPIDATMVSLQEWPKDKIPPGAISQLEDLEGRRPRAAIIEGEPLLEAKLLAPGQVADPIASIPPEMRLVTVAVDAETSAAGLLSPGDRVDVQLFVKANSRSGIEEAKTKIILQNIRVYAVDQAVQRSSDGGETRSVAKTISLLLTPEQAGKVHLAQKVGEISLIPRNPDDESTTAVPEITLADLMGDSDANSRGREQGRDEEQQAEDEDAGLGLLAAIQMAVPRPEEKPPWRMEIVLANQVHEQLFDAETGLPISPPPTDPRERLAPGTQNGNTQSAQPSTAPATGGVSPVESEMFEEAGFDDFPIDLGIE